MTDPRLALALLALICGLAPVLIWQFVTWKERP